MNITPHLTLEDKPLAELELSPTIRRTLEACLSTYATLTADAKLLQEQADLEKSKIGKLLADHGYDRVKTDEFSLTWVRGSTTSKLEPNKLIAQGVTLAQLDAATVTKPRKDYFQIRGKSERRSDPENG